MIELNDKNFKEEIKTRKFTLVDFYATWCMPCSMQAKVLEKMQSSRSLNFDIVKVNVDEAPSIASEYNIQSIPTLMIFKNDKLVKTIVGYTDEQEILESVEEFIK